MQKDIQINQSVAILCDGNNIERSIHEEANNTSAMVNFDTLISKLLSGRGLNRLIYFREGKNISSKLGERLHNQFYGSVVPCHKSADIPLSIKATQLASKVDTIIIMSGDSDYVDLVRHLKGEGVRVEIAAVEKTTARILVDEADYFHPITRDDWFVYSPGRNIPRGPHKHVNKPKPVSKEVKMDI
ncbi:MAG: NYN domain-containing protein [Candidatus Woesearchaeota archaeon]